MMSIFGYAFLKTLLEVLHYPFQHIPWHQMVLLEPHFFCVKPMFFKLRQNKITQHGDVTLRSHRYRLLSFSKAKYGRHLSDIRNHSCFRHKQFRQKWKCTKVSRKRCPTEV
uniref:Uncharacterized protein n=1 Tax=Cacopsylla melanoneura TaxID=428564 RepID=A0A8D8UBJ8_9HEMI